MKRVITVLSLFAVASKQHWKCEARTDERMDKPPLGRTQTWLRVE